MNQPFSPGSLTDPMIYPYLSALPISYQSNQRRTRALDTDEGGRRAGVPEDGVLDQKDMLPAYDNVGGPPKYMELAMDAARARMPLEFSSVVARDSEQAAVGREIPGHERDASTTTVRESNSHSDYSRPRHISATTSPQLVTPGANIPRAEESG